MSASKKRNVNRPRQCKGCRNYTRLDYRCNLRLQGCRYAKWNKDHMQNCPCGQCLVKSMCSKPCESLRWTPDFALYNSSSW